MGPIEQKGSSGGDQLTAEISASAIRTNLKLLRRLLAPSTKLCAVVKANCYGHGLAMLLGVISEMADCLAVTTAGEALELRRLGYEGGVLTFFPPSSYGQEESLCGLLDELIAKQITLTIVSPQEVDAVSIAAGRVGRSAEVHVKIDTGMTRGGTPADRAPALIEKIRSVEGVQLAGLYTHFATADEADKDFTRQQLKRFLATVEAVGGRSGLTLHAANSAAAIDLPETHLDMIRPGIAVYGLQPSDQMHTKLPLRPAMRLWGRLMQVKDVAARSRCGYGLTYTFQRDSRVGLVPMGYADGYLRCLSNKATMRVRNRDVPIRGRVSMDQIIIDLTDVTEAKPGDMVEIISADPTAPHSAENLARLAGTISYEIVSRIGPRARRVLVD